MTTDHVAIIKPDARGRFNLKKWLPSPGAYKVYIEEGKVTLEPVASE